MGAWERGCAAGVTALALLAGACGAPEREDLPAEPGPPATAPSAGPIRVVLWGDSLASEARDTFLAGMSSAAGVEVSARTATGPASCDLLGELRGAAATMDVALVELGADAPSACLRDPISGAPLPGTLVLDRFRREMQDALEALRGAGVDVVLLGAPDGRDALTGGLRHDVQLVLRDLAERNAGVRYADAGSVVHEHGRYTDTLPCLPFEDAARGCTDGRIPVRNPDGLHFCPQGGASGGACPAWSSGALRYGLAVTAAALDAVERVRDERPGALDPAEQPVTPACDAPYDAAVDEPVVRSLLGYGAPPDPPGDSPPVLLVGDSITEGSKVFLDGLFAKHGVRTEILSFGGTAPCDWFDQVSAAVERFDPQIVVAEFTGNALGRCMRGLGPGTFEYYERYAADAAELTRRASARGARVYWAGALPLSTPAGLDNVARLEQIYASTPGVAGILPVAQLFVDADGAYALDVPSRFPWERLDLARVRADDGAHLGDDATPFGRIRFAVAYVAFVDCLRAREGW
jgi:hypothetical protein